MTNLLTGAWTLSGLAAGKFGLPKNNLKVFSCFHCGGGSTMGYKLAGFDVLGGVEIDPEMMEIYRANHHPKLSYLMGVQEFKDLPANQIPSELFNLDVLDGSPPCSSFSMAGAREKLWGEAKKFREGQVDQVLDNLFFDFIKISQRLQPKVVIAENVKGLIMGNARGYVKQIFSEFNKAGYDTQLYLLNASRMGVPQARERTFFIARRKDLNLPKFDLAFNENEIPIGKVLADLPKDNVASGGEVMLKRWKAAPIGGYSKTASGNTFGFVFKADPAKPSATITAQPRVYHWSVCRRFNRNEVVRVQSFPDDFNFIKPGSAHANYVCGMSVPPFMMMRVAAEVAKALQPKSKA